jgi:fatty-acyl-CoA synthase
VTTVADLHPPISNTSVNINPALATARNAGLYRDHPALRYASAELSYSELDDKAARLAAVLTGDGVSAGDRVAYAGMNSAAFLITMLAAWRIGAIFVPTNFRLATAELEHVLTASGAAAIISEPGHKPIIDSVRGRTPLKSLLLVDDDPEVPRDTAPDGEWEPWSTALAAATPVNSIAPAGFDDPALLMFTSGTTGLPKGVVLTHGNLWWNSVNVDSRIDTRRGDVTYAAAPLFHIGALNSFTIRTLVRGGTVVLRRTFAAQQCLTDLIDYQVNTLFAVPTMLAALSRVPGVFDADLSHVRAIVVAGAPVPPSLLDQYAQCGIPLQQAWGLTETAPFATHLTGRADHRQAWISRNTDATHRGSCRGHSHQRTRRGRRAGRNPRSRTERDTWLLAESRSHRGRNRRRWLVPFRRRRLPRRGGLPLHRRPSKGHGDQRR